MELIELCLSVFLLLWILIVPIVFLSFIIFVLKSIYKITKNKKLFKRMINDMYNNSEITREEYKYLLNLNSTQRDLYMNMKLQNKVKDKSKMINL